MKRAGEAFRTTAPVFDQLDASVTTGVVKGLDGSGIDARDDDGLIEDVVDGIVARIWNLFQSTSHLPDARPQTLALECKERRIVVTLYRNPVGPENLVGHIAPLRLCLAAHLRSP